jgi:spermidine synthase
VGRLAALYFASGAAALVIETTWLRWFRLILGATAPAASATLVAFFAGHALGAALAARLAPRWRRPLRAYGVLELAAAAGALATPLLLGAGESATAALYDPLRDRPALLTALRFAIALAATLPAAMAFGATLPAIGAAAVREASRLGARGSALYAWNTAGAATGTALASFVLPDWLGVRGGYGVGVALGAAVGVAALGLARSGWAAGGALAGAGGAAPMASRRASRRAKAGGAQAQSAGAASAAPVPVSGTALAAFAALSGFAALGAQVLLVQSFAQVLNQSVYAFGAVLVVVLAALAAGAGMVAGLERRARVDPRAVLGWALAASALALAGFPAAFHAATGGLAFAGTDLPWPGYLFTSVALAAATAGPLLLAAALVLPATFALAGRAAARDAAPAALLGRLSAANTAGAIAGALAAPFVLLPALGLWGAFAGLAAACAAGALAVPAASRVRAARGAALAAGALALAAFADPFALSPVRLERGERLVRADTTPSGVVAVVERPDGHLIRTDNHYALGGTAERVHEERQGHLPLLLHPAPRAVAFLGTATAITAGAAVAHPIASLHLVEILPAVSAAARRDFGAANRRVHDDPRARVVLDDARNFLRATRERFDVVVGDLFVPWQSGTGSLYAREHFAAVRAHLRDGGVFCQWLPLYQLGREEVEIIARTFAESFPHAAVFRGDFYGAYPIAALCGFAGAPPPAAAVSGAARRLAAGGERDRWIADPLGPWALYVGALGPSAAALAAAPLETDDRPRIEALAARGHAGAGGRREPFVGLAWARFGESLRAADERAGFPLWPDLPEDARRAARGGSALQAAGAFYVERRPEESGRALAAAAGLLPARLLADAEEDPTAAEVWHHGGDGAGR